MPSVCPLSRPPAGLLDPTSNPQGPSPARYITPAAKALLQIDAPLHPERHPGVADNPTAMYKLLLLVVAMLALLAGAAALPMPQPQPQPQPQFLYTYPYYSGLTYGYPYYF